MDDQPPGSFPAPTRERDPGEDQPQHLAPHDAPPPAGPRSGRRGLVWLGLVLLIVAGLVLWLVLRAGPQPAPAGRSAAAAPTPVGTATISNGDMPIVLSGLGTVTPLATVTVKTQINGQLIEVAYQEGQVVKKGDFLAQIDPRPYQVALEQAEGQLAKDQAALKNAEIDLNRYKTLVAQNSIARQTADTQAALVQQDRGTVQADEAQVDTQKLNLTYCHIIAPVGGRVGLRQVDAGNYVQTSDAAGIVVITQLQPISVIFTLPEDNLPTVLRRVNAGATLTATAFDRTGATRLDQGKLQTIDNQIDTSTGTVKLRAVFDNPEQILFPNQFVNIQLLVDTLRNVSIVPTAAIQRGAPGPFVYIVKRDHTVAAQPVTLGPSDNQNSAVTKGVKAGDVVVTDGADRLKDGAKVTLAPAAPAAAGDAAPPAGQPPQGKGGGKKGGQKSGQHGGQHRQNSQSGG